MNNYLVLVFIAAITRSGHAGYPEFFSGISSQKVLTTFGVMRDANGLYARLKTVNISGKLNG
ncbi:MAG: hypothetical protein HQK65_05215 [Desulfamplus sp.]|nr:hypothetical protein [Desulfamplus sp.]